jgi:hypothetical protein
VDSGPGVTGFKNSSIVGSSIVGSSATSPKLVQFALRFRSQKQTALPPKPAPRWDFNKRFGKARAQYPLESNSFPLGSKSYSLKALAAIYFQRLAIGRGDATQCPDEVARNGALSRINFGQRFSWAPLAFCPGPPKFVVSINILVSKYRTGFSACVGLDRCFRWKRVALSSWTEN